jgi:hypothetical protein
VNRDLKKLVDMAREVHMTPTELREQRRSFVYCNTHNENDRITRELVAEISKSRRETDR